MKIDKVTNIGIYLLIFLIPFQLYFNFYKNLSVSLAQIVAGLVFAATFWSFIRGGKKLQCLKGPLAWAVIFLMCAMLLSVPGSDDRINSIKYLIKWLSFALLFFVAYLNITDISSIKKAMNVFLLAAAAVSLAAIFEYTQGPDKTIDWFNRSSLGSVIMEPETLREKLSTSSFNWITWNGERSVLRAFGTFECVIVFSAYLGLIIPFFIGIAGRDRKWMLISVLLAGAVICAILLTFTRSAYLSFLVTGIVYLLLNRKKINKRWLIPGILLAGAVVLLLVAVKPVGKTINLRFSQLITEKIDRKQLWIDGLKIFSSRPLTGVGIANYHNGFQKYVSEKITPLPAHNQYIQTAAETGIIGLAAYLAIIFFGMRYSFLVFRDSSDSQIKNFGLCFVGMWAWYSVQSMFANYLFSDKFSMMFWLMLGLNAALYRIHKTVKSYYEN